MGVRRSLLSLAVISVACPALAAAAQASAVICNSNDIQALKTASATHFLEGHYDSYFMKVSADNHSAGAETFVANMGKKALGFLGNGSLNKEQKREEFRKLLNSNFDMNTIGRFSLGRYWRVAAPEQRKEYLSLFRSMIVDIYTERFSEYQGQKLETIGHRSDGQRDTIVSSIIKSNDGSPDIQVDWRVRHKNGQYRVVDIIVEGVSMSVTQRSDFSAVIQRGGGDVKVLLAHLRGE